MEGQIFVATLNILTVFPKFLAFQSRIFAFRKEEMLYVSI